jgi:DNA invertase Pin-like site-specific DNA recombinase
MLESSVLFEELLGMLAEGDRLVVSELSRLGRSLGQMIQIVDELVKRKVRFTAIKEASALRKGRTCRPR